MKKYSLAVIVGGAILSVVPASANSTTFNFANVQAGSTGNSYGNSLSFTVGGITVTETAFYVAAGYTGSTKFGAAAVDNYSGSTLGLGVCSPNDPGGTGCGSPSHQVDNAVGDEFILFTFSGGTVGLGTGSSIQVANYAPDPNGSGTAVDLTYYSASTAIVAGTTTMSSETGAHTVDANAGSGVTVTDSNLIGGNITYLLIGAAVNDSVDDAFKVNSLTVNTSNSVTATPEPATFGLIGLALAGLGVYGRKRKSRNN
jgi:hypothetical protein